MKQLEDVFIGATFKDFMLRPQYGVVLSRTQDDIDLSMPLTRNIILHGAPIISANMRTVTGGRMMKRMSSLGCFGFIHRAYSNEVQAEKVREIKRSQSYIIENPFVVHRKSTLGEVRELVRKNKISGLLVEEEPDSNILAGILSRRDIFGADSWLVEDRMTGLHDIVFADSNISIEKAENIMHEIRKEKLPLIDKERKIMGLITMRDLKKAKQEPYTTKDDKGRLRVGAATGASRDYIKRAEMLVDAGVDVILVDIAHAHWKLMPDVITNLRSRFQDVELIVGNVATGEGAKFLADLGVDAIKVGIGPGRGCRTRLDVRFGVPQLQAVREAYLAVEGRVPIIADGGLDDDGDIVMALLAGGASTVMLGGMLAGTDEAPGLVDTNGMKMYKGETSIDSTLEDFNDDENLEELLEDMQAPEGQLRPVKYTGGSVAKEIKRIKGHLKSAVSYSGEATLQEAHRKISNDPLKYINNRLLSEASRKESFDR